MTDPKKSSLGHVVNARDAINARLDSNVATIKGDIQSPTKMYNPLTPRGRGATTDATRVARPEPAKLSQSDREVATKRTADVTYNATKESVKSKVAQGSRQVAANKAADAYRASRKK